MNILSEEFLLSILFKQMECVFSLVMRGKHQISPHTPLLDEYLNLSFKEIHSDSEGELRLSSFGIVRIRRKKITEIPPDNGGPILVCNWGIFYKYS